MKQTKSGKIACGTPGCHKLATVKERCEHIKSWGQCVDLFSCTSHIAPSGTVVEQHAQGWIATAQYGTGHGMSGIMGYATSKA